jgi:thiol-disulfide isomerase/thioredoxin
VDDFFFTLKEIMATTSKNFVELTSAETLTDFLNDNEESGCVLTFSATWCGPCKACKPRLKDEVSSKSPVPIGYVYESDLDPEFFDVFVEISAFPTFVFFRKGLEISRVEGVDLEAVEAMILRETTTTAS